MGRWLWRDIHTPFAKAEGTDFLSKEDGFALLSPERLLAIVTEVLLSAYEFQTSDNCAEHCS